MASLRQLLDSLSREQRRNQELLASLGFALRSFTNLGRFLELVPLVTARLVEAEGAVLVVFHPDGRLWREQLHAAPPGASGELLRQLASLSDQELLQASGDEAVAALLDRLVRRQLGDRPLFATSVVARSRVRGRLYLFGARSGLSWSEVHRGHAQLVADLTGVAIESEQLQQQARRHERVDRQLSIGAEIQAQLLGRRREQGRWALVMGDVMGKGVPAGLLMTLLRGMLRAEVLSGHPPDRILHDLNQLAQEDLAHSHRFVTLFYSDFDPRTRLLRYANAAHNPPLIWRRLRNAVDRLDAPGLLIGLQPEAEYGCEQIVLDPGDVLLYYTDGVTEASGLNGERFDEQRLVQALQTACRSGVGAQGILDQLYARLDRFVGPDRPLEDDASMVVLKVREEVMLPSLPA
jgi:sigma-B regulation protein RsbU (phosphoserine phosphatase)